MQIIVKWKRQFLSRPTYCHLSPFRSAATLCGVEFNGYLCLWAACNPSPCSRLTPSQFHPEMIFKLENSGHATLSSSSAPSSNSHGMVPHALQFNFPSAVPSVRYNISHPLPVRSGSFVLVGSWRIKFAI